MCDYNEWITGECISLMQCPPVLGSLSYQIGIPISNSIVCGYDSRSQPIVCCPRERKLIQFTRPPQTQTSPTTQVQQVQPQNKPQPAVSTTSSPSQARPVLPKPQRPPNTNDPQRYDDQTVQIIDLPEPKPMSQKAQFKPQQVVHQVQPERQTQRPLAETKPEIQSQTQSSVLQKGQIAKRGISSINYSLYVSIF